jgi:two-component system sensor histidine kinase YesM
VTPRKLGGRVVVTARDAGDGLTVTVVDTGVGVASSELATRRTRGIGLANVEARLGHYYGAAATLTVRSVPGVGTTVEVHVPITTPALVDR